MNRAFNIIYSNLKRVMIPHCQWLGLQWSKQACCFLQSWNHLHANQQKNVQFTTTLLISLCHIIPTSLLSILCVHNVLASMQPQWNMLTCPNKLICQRAVEKCKWKCNGEHNFKCCNSHAWPCTKWSYFPDGQQ